MWGEKKTWRSDISVVVNITCRSPSTLYFTRADPHFLLVCLRGLGLLIRVASLRLAIFKQKRHFLNKAICWAGVLSFSITHQQSDSCCSHSQQPRLKVGILTKVIRERQSFCLCSNYFMKWTTPAIQIGCRGSNQSQRLSGWFTAATVSQLKENESLTVMIIDSSRSVKNVKHLLVPAS